MFVDSFIATRFLRMVTVALLVVALGVASMAKPTPKDNPEYDVCNNWSEWISYFYDYCDDADDGTTTPDPGNLITQKLTYVGILPDTNIPSVISLQIIPGGLSNTNSNKGNTDKSPPTISTTIKSSSIGISSTTKTSSPTNVPTAEISSEAAPTTASGS